MKGVLFKGDSSDVVTTIELEEPNYQKMLECVRECVKKELLEEGLAPAVGTSGGLCPPEGMF